MRYFIAAAAGLLVAISLHAQTAVSGTGKTKSIPEKNTDSAKPQAEKKPDNPLAKNFLGGDSESTEPVVTEIYSDEAFFDSTKNMGTFSGRVKIVDPRFNLQSDKVTVFLTKGEEQGLQKAIADGNVGVVRERPDPNGGPPTHSVGRSDHAVYTTSDGNVVMTGTPRVQQGINMHVATSPDTVMILNQAGQLTTHGPSRTEIHEEAKDSGEKADKKEKKGKKNKAEAKKE